MPERLVLPGPSDAQLGGSAGADISQLVTGRLKPLQPQLESDDHLIAHYEAEIRRLAELADAVEQAVTALVVRLHMVSDDRVREALQHNRADLQRFKDELDSVRDEHRNSIIRVRERA